MRRGHVDQDARGLHARAEFADALLVQVLVGVEHAGVADAAERDEVGGGVHRRGEVLAAVQRQRRRQLLVGERLVVGGLLDLADQNLGVAGHLQAGALGDLDRRLADDVGIEVAVVEHRLADGVEFLAGQDVAAMGGEALAHRIIDRIDRDHRLLGGADHAVVEGL